MKEIRVKDLTPGMILAENAVSPNGHIVLSKKSRLSDRLISSLQIYNIYSVFVEDELPKFVECVNSQRSGMIVNDKEFVVFKKEYLNAVEDISEDINKIVYMNMDEINLVKLSKKSEELIKGEYSYNIIDMMHNIREYDDSTFSHSMNVSLIAALLGRWAKWSNEEVQLLIVSGMLHDIGKLRIPEAILKKPGRLTPQEFSIIKNHPMEGYQLIDGYEISEHVKNAVLYHHERIDGSGYPMHLKGDEIDKFAKIIAIADVYDAMTSRRVYRGPLCPFTAIDIMIQDGADKFDKDLLSIFLQHIGSTYIGNEVLLSDDSVGTIMSMPEDSPSRPVIKLKSGKVIDLSKEISLEVVEVN